MNEEMAKDELIEETQSAESLAPAHDELEPQEPTETPVHQKLERLESLTEAQAKFIRQQQSQMDKILHQQRQVDPLVGNTPPSAPLAKPDAGKFQDEEGYLEALVKYQLEKSNIGNLVDQRLQQQQEQDLLREHSKRLQERGEALSKEKPDYHLVAFSPDAQSFYQSTPGLSELVTSMPNNSEIAYYLGSNLDVLAKISAISPVFRAAEIAKINEKFNVGQGKKNSSAPPPITPVKGTTKATGKNPDDMTMDEWLAWRKSQQI